MASVYASLKNMPLVIENSLNDNSAILNGKRLICAGNVNPVEGCFERYNQSFPVENSRIII